MISQTVEYALRAIVTLAQNNGRPCTSQEISEITKVPWPYLSKLMQGLVRAGMIRSQRGLHGGFVLRKRPAELTIWDVVEAVEPLKRIRECPLDISTHGTNLCPLHRRLDEALALVEKSFRETTLDQLLAQADSVTPLCEDRRVVQIRGVSKPTKTSTPKTKASSKKKKKSKKRS
jgi:Rrf2 family protein